MNPESSADVPFATREEMVRYLLRLQVEEGAWTVTLDSRGMLRLRNVVRS